MLRATCASDRGDDPSVSRDFADAGVGGVDGERVARGVGGDVVREVQLCAGGRAAVTAEAGDAGAGDRADESGAGRHPANAQVALIRDEEVAHGVDNDTARVVQLGARGWAVVAAEARDAGAGDGGDDPSVSRHFADAAVGGVRDEEVAPGVDDDSAPATRVWCLAQDDEGEAQSYERMQAGARTAARFHKWQPEKMTRRDRVSKLRGPSRFAAYGGESSY